MVPTSSLRLRMLLLAIAYGSVQHGVAVAEEPIPGGVPERISQLSDDEVNRRLAFLEDRLDARRDYAWYWWHGWVAVYSAGVVVESYEASVHSSPAHRADNIAGAVKAAGGTIVLLIRPLQAQNGADAVRALPDTTPADRRRRLAVAEEQLRSNAEASNRRYWWVRHAANVAVNSAAALIVWKGYGDASRGWRSAGIGMAVGETMIWSQPWQPADDWEDYQRRFDRGAGQQVSWHIAPTIGGVALQVDF